MHNAKTHVSTQEKTPPPGPRLSSTDEHEGRTASAARPAVERPQAPDRIVDCIRASGRATS